MSQSAALPSFASTCFQLFGIQAVKKLNDSWPALSVFQLPLVLSRIFWLTFLFRALTNILAALEIHQVLINLGLRKGF